MSRDLVSLGSYVRFYQTVLEQLDAAWKEISDVHHEARAELLPYQAPLQSIESPLLSVTLAEAQERPDELQALWRPEDSTELQGIADVYEVVGRFSFQGVDNDNLARVQSLVSAARNQLHSLRARLSDLSGLPAQITTGASRLEELESRALAGDRAQRLASFQPLASMLQARAKQTIDAVRAVPLPDVQNPETAAEEWRRFSTKTNQVYGTCLPYLQKALVALFEFVGAEVPASWPDVLPLVTEMPPSLFSVPPAGSEELSTAEAALSSLGAEQAALSQTQIDLGINIARLDGELAALSSRDAEFRAEIGVAMAVVDYIDALALIDETRIRGLAYEQQKAERVASQGEVFRRNTESQSALAALEDELAARAKDIATLSDDLVTLRSKEPVLFGKDEWRSKVSGLEEDLAAHRSTQAQRVAVLNQIKIDLASMSVQLQTEASQLALIDRSIEAGQKRIAALGESARTMEASLGQNRPIRPLTTTDTRELLAAAHQRRADLADRIERLLGERRRQKEESARTTARLSQIEGEGQRFRGQVESARIAATEGREAAIRQLAVQRKVAVEQHVEEVLGGLGTSLGSVDQLFLEPAQEVLLKDRETGPRASELARAAAIEIAPKVETLVRELSPRLLATDAMLGQIQREFCDNAPDACAQAWG